MTKFNKYLYQAVYNDGTVYDQNAEDRSIDDSGKSCYSDLKLNDVHYFTLSNGEHAYTLDLVDGGIAVNGSEKFYIGPREATGYRLVYFRRVKLRVVDDFESSETTYILGYTSILGEGERKTYSITIV